MTAARFGTAEEAAAQALFLMANYVTGQVITVDGGETLAWPRPADALEGPCRNVAQALKMVAQALKMLAGSSR